MADANHQMSTCSGECIIAMDVKCSTDAAHTQVRQALVSFYRAGPMRCQTNIERP